MIYPAWTIAPTVYPDWLGAAVLIWVDGDVVILDRESRLLRLDDDRRFHMLSTEARIDGLDFEPRVALCIREQRLMNLSHEPRVIRLWGEA